MFMFVIPPLLFLSLLLLESLASGAPLYITSAGEFIAFSNAVLGGTDYAGATVFLANDIDFSGSSSQFKPIGDSSNYFRGVFDGQGHKISNLVVNADASRHAGLFGYSQGLTIRNLVLDPTCTISRTATSSSGYNTFVGGFVGCVDVNERDCILVNNVNMASVSFPGTSDSYIYMGGISGMLCPGDNTYQIVVRNCANYGDVSFTGSASKTSYIGGIVGDVTYSTTTTTGTRLVQNCINYGTVKSTGTVSGNMHFVGGIAGVASSPAKVENCVNAGKLTPSSGTYAGNIVGYAYHGTSIFSCYWTDGTGNSKSYGTNYGSETVTVKGSSQISDYSETVSALNKYNTAWNRWVYNTNSVSITFNINKGAGFTFTSSKLILLPSLVESSGLTFSGWYSDPFCTNTFTSTTISTSSSMNLYGGWVYTLTYNGNGVTPSQSTKSVVYGQLYGTLSGATRDGYTFLGWYTTSSGGTKVESNTKVTTANNHILYAHWEANKYTVIFDGNGGAPSQQNTTVTYDETYETFPDVTRTGYTFLGWYTTSSGGAKVEANTKVTTANNHILYAHWEANKYTVTFDGNGGTPSQQNITVTYYETYTALPDVTRTGYTFLGWYTNITEGNKVETTTNVTNAYNHTLYAHWEANKYNVTFDGNGGAPSQSNITVTYDETYKTFPDATRTGYTFLGWYTDITEGNKVEVNTNVTNAYNHTLYAHWAINNYTVIFNIDNITTIDEEYQFNETIEYQINIPEMEGYMFIGWDKNITAMPDYNITINAVWSKVTKYVEIVFGTKDLTEDEIKEIINQYANSTFTIIAFENKSEGTKVIIRFTETEEAKNFVETIKSDTIIKSVYFIPDDAYSFFPALFPIPFLFALLSV